MHETVEQRAPRKAAARQQHRDRDPEGQAGKRGNNRHPQAEPDRVEFARGEDRQRQEPGAMKRKPCASKSARADDD
jgi:hypothetical protein